MPMIDQLREEIARLKRDEAGLIKKRSSDQAESAKAVADARAKREQASRTSSTMMARSYLQAAERLDKRAVEYERKVADTTAKLADNSRKQAHKSRSLEAALRNAQQQQDREAERRRQLEKRHTQDIARLARPTVRYVHEVRMIEPPRIERLRVLYLAANPDMDVRVDAEVRQVREAVKKALHRDLVDIDHRPAATPEDLLDGLNEVQPHVIHFSGHGGDAAVLFDDGQVEDSQGRDVSFNLLRRALGATDKPPTLLLLNACDTLDGAEVLLDVVPVVIAMAANISDLAAAVFATRFYAAIANGQSVGSALAQGSVGVDLALLDEGWKPNALVRDGVSLSELILVQPPSA